MKMLISFLIMFFIFTTCGVFGVDDYRVALADDIAIGKLKMTEDAGVFIKKGDRLLSESVENQSSWGTVVTERSLYKAIIARIFFERARLEMEMQKIEKEKKKDYDSIK